MPSAEYMREWRKRNPRSKAKDRSRHVPTNDKPTPEERAEIKLRSQAQKPVDLPPMLRRRCPVCRTIFTTGDVRQVQCDRCEAMVLMP